MGAKPRRPIDTWASPHELSGRSLGLSVIHQAAAIG